MELHLNNVRSFCGEHRIPIKPLTLLVGENSSGKSTLLAMLAAVSGPWFPSAKHSFALPPYDLGSYDSISTYKGGRYGRAAEFQVGYALERKEGSIRATGTYVDNHGQPELSFFEVKFKDQHIKIKFDEGQYHADFGSSKSARNSLTIEGTLPEGVDLTAQGLPNVLIGRFFEISKKERESGAVQNEHFLEVFNLLRQLVSHAPEQATSIAPIRTKPKRTYDELTDEFKPEGDHVPLVLARTWAFGKAQDAKILRDTMLEFGQDSGLFRDIDVRMLGPRPSSPFQILVKVSGVFTNLADVGYGVSQSLPVIVESVLASKQRRLLLQQPEVHLHPKAQAALGTFLARLVSARHKQFVVETHSDFVIDRIRQEISKGKLDHNDVLLLFLERDGAETSVHKINFDKNGSVVSAPPTYRNFFMEEEMNLFERIQK
jgi:energy-coupling factor transporter ATP-binding protein EcfA2